MDIYFFGLTSVRLRGRKTAIVIDPFTKATAGVKFKSTEADAILLTAKNASHTSFDLVQNARVVIDGAGEYEVGGSSIIGIPIGDITTYCIKIDGIILLHLGALQRALTDSEFDKYPTIDIAFVPVAKGIAEMVAKLEPKIVIPINFAQLGVKGDSFLESVDVFLKEIGKEDIKPQQKLSITKEKMPSELEVVWLS